MKTLKDIDVKNKKVLLRVDFNVPIEQGKVANDFRIKSVLPTIEYLLNNQAKIIILTHLGRPQGKVVKDLRVDLVAKRLGEIIKRPIKKIDNSIGLEAEEEIKKMQPGEIIFLENVQFNQGEIDNLDEYSQALAELADVFVQEAFGQVHRDYASISGVPKYLPSCAGLLMEKEIKVLTEVMEDPKRPLIVIIGGAKISDKIKMIRKFIKSADHILLGGALANTVLWAEGIAIGKSKIEKEELKEASDIDHAHHKLHLPVDAIASSDPGGQMPVRITPIGKVSEDEMILDIGPDTEKLYSQIINQAQMILWNGPMGIFEVKVFSGGSEKVAEAVAKSKAFKVVGGGDTISCLEELNLLDKMDHVSTGGGAMLEFLSGNKLPGIEALK